MNAFRSAIHDCDLSDLGFTGRWYTWERGAFSSTNVRERLDRGLANAAWCALFPDSSVAHLLHNFSGHCSILSDTIGSLHPTAVTKVPRFRFNANWVLEEDFLDVVQSFWSTNKDPLPTKLLGLGSILQIWSRGRYTSRKANANKLNAHLAELVMEEPDDDRLLELMEVKLALNLEADKEEMFWEQRARTNWLKCGDRNTAFFYNWASARKRKNVIRSLIANDGSTVSDDVEMENLATEHFKGVFTASIVSDQDFVIDKVSPTISASMNSALTMAYSREEIYSVVKDMAPLKAFGLDGYPALFYQKCWSVIGTEVADFCLSILSGSMTFDSFNSTSIVLIPKVDDPRSLDQFRPISLCSVLYKIISKAIANRFRRALDVCIDHSQSAFVPGRQISNNILIAYELLHAMKNKRSGSKGSFALKLDMAMAYDRVDWGFLERMLLKMGFDHRFVLTIMECVSSVSYSVSFNAEDGETFKPSRGLRQGDPLSPYLFLICAEGFSALLNDAKLSNTLHGTKAGRYGLSLTHLFFADDSILFGSSNAVEAGALHRILSAYERASGQLVNFSKSSIFFSSNTSTHIRNHISALFSVRFVSSMEKYLGLPTMVGKNKKAAFAELRDKLNRRSDVWSNWFFSMGAKEVFIKSIMQVVPIYAMQCFLFPKSLCCSMESIMCKFWWRNNNTRKGIHWAS
ncbi:hypothetical protein HRI_003237000 [Hibiscus trionum]|uniref:Reverse transcriptase domain-containing protein n=1 Tax=Hibiscus trionum TaxID=183268 RepID=A0A9W7IID1_HIBTR|nr:hypothetical protein HRI_003237000 [Hibiscus trionum]